MEYREQQAYTRAEAAEILGVSEKDVQWFIDTGQLTPVQMFGAQYLLARDIHELLRVYQQIYCRGKKRG